MGSFLSYVDECVALFTALRATPDMLQTAADACVATLNEGGKFLICGNGGSAAEAQHLAGELVGKFRSARRPLPALVLPGDMAVATCIGNDFRFADLFSRPVRALGGPRDLLIAYSTSGRSENILEALLAARSLGMRSLLFTGRDGGPARSLATHSVVVPHHDTARIQEVHQFLTHCLVESIEGHLKDPA